MENDYKCVCPRGFYGKNCEVSAMTCADGPCFNGGTCVEKSSGGGYSCRCPLTYHGSNCEKKIDRCSNSPCLNGGHCLDMGRSVVCKCRPGFSGPRCELNIDDCARGPCANGGTCVDGVNSYTCSCTLGYGGNDCALRMDACSSRPCHNGGTCYTHFSGHVCECPVGLMGSSCEFRVQAPTPSSSHADPPFMLALAASMGLGLVTLCLLSCAVVLVMRGVRRAQDHRKGRVTNDLETRNNLKEKDPFLISPPHFKVPNQDCLRDKSSSKQKLLQLSESEEERGAHRSTDRRKSDVRHYSPPKGYSKEGGYHPIYMLPDPSEQCIFATEV
ncbi:uncharacterized protein LOC142499194 [Ascaphus truei]|uniref:uncharacterized protein LOC142499194 n=1 Tax=Ascaphus truei TaxID=8439 RepID=UPI003F5A22C7